MRTIALETASRLLEHRGILIVVTALTTDMADTSKRPYFLWDEELTIGELRSRLASGSESERLRQFISNHARYTGSTRAREILENWETMRPKFRKVMPVEYKRALIELLAKGKPARLKVAGE